MISPNRYSSGWESGCGPADPTLSKIKTSANASPYSGNGYATVGSGEVGTINAGVSTPVTAQGQAALLRAYVWNGQLYFVDGVTGTAYVAGPSVQIPEAATYSPTK